jgi:hypothetical protein
LNNHQNEGCVIHLKSIKFSPTTIILAFSREPLAICLRNIPENPSPHSFSPDSRRSYFDSLTNTVTTDIYFIECLYVLCDGFAVSKDPRPAASSAAASTAYLMNQYRAKFEYRPASLRRLAHLSSARAKGTATGAGSGEEGVTLCTTATPDRLDCLLRQVRKLYTLIRWDETVGLFHVNVVSLLLLLTFQKNSEDRIKRDSQLRMQV